MNNTTDADECLSFEPPLAKVYLENLSTEWLILTILAGVSAFAITCIFAEKVYQIVRHLWKWKHRNHALVLQGLYPVYAVTSFFSLLVPRAERTSDFVGCLYMSLALFAYVQLVTDFHGGMENMKQKLANSEEIELRSFPVCCCCLCLPKLKISIRNLTYIQLLIYQFALIKPLLYYSVMVLMDNNREDYVDDPVYATVLNYTMSASSLLAMWGNVMLFKISSRPLRELNIRIKFACVQTVLLSDNIQRTIEEFIWSIVGLSCSNQLDTFSAKLRWHSLFVAFEMLPLAILSRISIGRDKPMFRDIKRTDSTTHIVGNTLPNGLHVVNGVPNGISKSAHDSLGKTESDFSHVAHL